jgi:hypothetical protein
VAEGWPDQVALLENLRRGADPRTLTRVRALSADRRDKAAVRLADAHVRSAVAVVYARRRDRQVNPEGDFDSAGRPWPSEREDAGGNGSCVREPSQAWPYSYLTRCRAREHCRVLVRRSVWTDVPDDVTEVVRARGLWEQVRQILQGE